MRILFFSVFVLSMTGCLKTRSEVKETEQKQVMQQQVSSWQKNSADTSNRFTEMEEEIRALNGRIEVLENKLSVSGQDAERDKKSLQEQNNDLQRKITLLQDTMGKMDMTINQMIAELAAVKAERTAHQVQNAATGMGKRTTYEVAQELFNQREWKRAATQFDKFRQESPKSKSIPEVTYKIGVCFQELGMKDEARSFYEEVISKYPNSEDARRAKVRIKSVKR